MHCNYGSGRRDAALTQWAWSNHFYFCDTLRRIRKGDRERSGQCPDVLCDRCKVQGLSELLQVVCVDEACFGTEREEVGTISYIN